MNHTQLFSEKVTGKSLCIARNPQNPDGTFSSIPIDLPEKIVHVSQSNKITEKYKRWVSTFIWPFIFIIIAIMWYLKIPTSTLTPTSSKPVIERVVIPGGISQIGDDGVANAAPTFKVELPKFALAKYEVSNETYKKCVDAGNCVQPELPEYFKLENARHPVVGLTWREAQSFCAWVGGRLPTEFEWERAARNDTDNRYPWGNDAPDDSKLNLCDINCGPTGLNANLDDGFAATSPVGVYPAGATSLGLHDMAGNVWEWTESWYEKGYAVIDGKVQLPNEGKLRAVRGGSWLNDKTATTNYSRIGFAPNARDKTVGFRCLFPLTEP